jgi:hypothetical protein
MKLSTDGFYRTRGGNKARIYATDGATYYPIHGAVLRDGEWAAWTWTAEGRSSSRVGVFELSDIVGRWPQEKEVEVWVWLCENGDTVTACKAPGPGARTRSADAYDAVVGAVRLTGTVTEGRFG